MALAVVLLVEPFNGYACAGTGFAMEADACRRGIYEIPSIARRADVIPVNAIGRARGHRHPLNRGCGGSGFVTIIPADAG